MNFEHMQRKSARRTNGFSATCGVITAVAFWSCSAAYASPFTLGAFDTYGLLINNGAAGGDINTAPVNANIGIGTIENGHSVNLHNEVVNGKVDCSGSCSTAVSGGAITGTQPVSLGGSPPSGSPAALNSNVTAVGAAINQALSLSSIYGAEAASGKSTSINTGSQTINATSGFLDSSGAYLFTTPQFQIGNGDTLTINGTISQFVVIDVTGTSNDNLNGALMLTGGITPDQVLINFLGTSGNVQGAANGATLDGTFLIPDMGVNLDNLTIDGHLFGGASGDSFQFVSGARIDQPALETTPVPAALPLFASGLGALGLFGWRGKRKKQAAA